jgi:cyanuric acid amidohydrolase
MLSARLDLPLDRVRAQVPMLMIGGTAGLMSPHFVLFFRRMSTRATVDAGLRIGTARSRRLGAAEIGAPPALEASAEAVRAAMDDAGGLSPQDVVCVEMKCPQGGGDAELGSRSRAAAALGAAVALGEIEAGAARSALADRRADLFSTKASTSSCGRSSTLRVVRSLSRRSRRSASPTSRRRSHREPNGGWSVSVPGRSSTRR